LASTKVKVTGNENVNIVFAHIFIKNVSITSKQDRNDHRPILQYTYRGITFHQRKCFVL